MKNLKRMTNTYLERYNKGSDEFYYREVKYDTFDKVCPSIKDHPPIATV